MNQTKLRKVEYVEKRKNLVEKRNEIKVNETEKTFKKLRTIQSIAKRSAIHKDAVFDNLLELIYDKGILFQSIGNISKKKGSLTPGPEMDPRTVDGTSIDLVEKLSEEIKNGKFKFKPIRRIYMDKSGKNPIPEKEKTKIIELHKLGKVTMDQVKELRRRPIGISSFRDKIVQEAIRIVLNSIYEPIFSRHNMNKGFRPKYGCVDSIMDIKTYSKQMDYAIEGDIKGAFDNVNHNILIQILRKKIKDERFLKLIYGGLKCGIIYLKYIQPSDLGTTQGSVVSPLLYNIYFNEFDEFINDEFRKSVEQLNEVERRTPKPINKLYNSISKKKTKLKLREKLEKIRVEKDSPSVREGDFENLKILQKELKETSRKYKELDKQQKKIPVISKSRQTIRFSYHRYADDWVLFTNADYERVIEWKEWFSNWIQENLKLRLSPEKTRISNLRKGEYVKFLGFQLSRPKKRNEKNLVKVYTNTKRIRTDSIKRKRKLVRTLGNRDRINYRSRVINPTLIAAWDRERVLSRMENNGFIKKEGRTFRGKSKDSWVTLSEPEIIDRYNYIIRGYIGYYTPVVDHPTDFLFLYYLLKYSCAHTLAKKRRTTLRKLFKKFGKDIGINYIEKVEKIERDGTKLFKEMKKRTQLMSWKQCDDFMRRIMIRTRMKQKSKKYDSISIVNKSVEDICNVKVNWRTSYKLSKYCSICGSNREIEYHHIKHIKVGKVTGFVQIMKQLNRKQIPCCKECHNKIHRGQYNGISLNDIYDEELIIL